MNVLRQWFLRHLAQTSDSPLGLEITRAEGNYLFDIDGKKYLDLISGISVSNFGHSNPSINQAIKDQIDKHLHLMVYGEYIQSPQVNYAHQLSTLLPEQLDTIYFVNSGSEAVETALKLAKKVSRETEIISFYKAYHGSTHGALSIMGDEYYKQAFRPLLPDIKFIQFNAADQLNQITSSTACVIVEPIQGEAGVIVPQSDFLKKLRKHCDKTNTLLIFDEIQTGFGRTGSMFAFQKYGVTPDILVLAKALGGGMPLGAVISSNELLNSFRNNPILGHITTFGGHPVSCAAGIAALDILNDGNILHGIQEKSLQFKKLLKHKDIQEVRGEGLLLACQLKDSEQVKKVIKECIKNGLIIDGFLFCDSAFRIAPPLTIEHNEINEACEIINQAIEKVENKG